MAKPRPLGVWLYGIRVAEIDTRRNGADIGCKYSAEALERWPGNAPLLSCSLPLIKARQDASVFFRELLPEGGHLLAMAAEARVASYDTLGLLTRFGRDVAGAVVVSAEDPAERPGEVQPYSEEALSREVAELPERPLGIHDDSELSLPGLQNKLLLVELDGGGWGRPIHGRPSTHILKVENADYPRMVELEAACLRLARAADLTTVSAQTKVFDDKPCLIVSRFDRRTQDGVVSRVHQEDSCQALGRSSDAAQRRGKYESAGGPSLRELADLLDRYARDAGAELERLVAVVTFTILIGNADAHGKNLAFLHREPGVISLAPLYDTVPTALWPKLQREYAMSVNHKRSPDTIRLDDVMAEALRWPFDTGRARRVAQATIDIVLDGCDREEVPDDLAGLIRARASELRSSEFS